MVDVDNMSDAELRTKLIEYGFPVMPITNTTRKIMVKKLKMLMDNKSKVNHDSRRSLSRYSSEEESDTEIKSKKKDKNRRATIGTSLMQPPTSSKLPVKRTPTRHDYDNNVEAPVILTKKEKITTTTTKKIIEAEDHDFDTGSDSEPELISEFSNDTRKSNSGLSPYRLTSPRYESKEVPVITSSPSRYSSYTSPSSSASDYAAERLNSIRSRLSLGTSPVLDKPIYTSPLKDDVLNDEEHTPFLSNFTRRLSKISTEKKVTGDSLEEHDLNGSSNFIRTYMNKPIRPREYARSYGTNKENNSKNNLVSLTVIGLAFLFFVVVAVVYLGLHSGNSALEATGHEVPYCTKNVDIKKIGFDCILTDDYPFVISMLRLLKPELHKRAIAHKCENSLIKPYMTERDLIHFISTNTEMKSDIIQTQLNNFLVLIFNNPTWSISVIYGEDSEHMGDNIIENMEQLLKYKTTNEIALTIKNPDLPWRCSISIKMAKTLNTILIVIILSLLVYFSNIALKYYKNYQQKQKDELFHMVGRIVDILQSNATEDAENNFLVINHVRDMILPIKERKSMHKIWTNAVQFINENDSRIRTEIQVVQGEPYEVWRWLGASNLNTSRSKSWQGQAFETQVGSVNSLQCSPTPCLKIRGMVEDGDRKLHTIREAVLSKCAHHCQILHCAVDTSSKCVYLKCADQNDAAIAYRNLHGWWYAGHLVTVKYLRLERYMQRYPESPVSGPPFLRAIQPAADWSN